MDREIKWLWDIEKPWEQFVMFAVATAFAFVIGIVPGMIIALNGMFELFVVFSIGLLFAYLLVRIILNSEGFFGIVYILVGISVITASDGVLFLAWVFVVWMMLLYVVKELAVRSRSKS